eukprot:scaffold50119_cov19-Tisochrysis_lutea.AAC.1
MVILVSLYTWKVGACTDGSSHTAASKCCILLAVVLCLCTRARWVHSLVAILFVWPWPFVVVMSACLHRGCALRCALLPYTQARTAMQMGQRIEHHTECCVWGMAGGHFFEFLVAHPSAADLAWHISELRKLRIVAKKRVSGARKLSRTWWLSNLTCVHRQESTSKAKSRKFENDVDVATLDLTDYSVLVTGLPRHAGVHE